jgi:hypothetical protein
MPMARYVFSFAHARNRVFASERVEKFLSEVDPSVLFPPTRQRVLENLRTTPFSALAKVCPEETVLR